MKDIINTINGNSLELLKKLIGQKIISIKRETFHHNEPSVFQRIGIITNSGVYCIDNPVSWFDNFYAGAEFLPHMTFSKFQNEDQLEENMGLEDFKAYPIGEVITNILIINDYLDVQKKGIHFQEWNSTEGIIIKTEVRQYAFYKANTCWDESVLVYKGHNVLTKLKPLEKHWNDTFGQEYEAIAKRYLISLADESSKTIDEATILGKE